MADKFWFYKYSQVDCEPKLERQMLLTTCPDEW